MDWGLIVGCDQYREPLRSLAGCVRDAVSMYRWVIDPKGGNVPDDHVVLLLSPSNRGEQVPAGLNAEPATNENIQLAVSRIVDESEGVGDRLFVHYSGHGVMARVDFIDEPAIVPEDFTDRLTDRALTIRSIYETFATTRIREQFFFFDACRNIPWEEEYRVGQIARPRRANYDLATPEQFICFATSRGLTSQEKKFEGDERGAFTTSVLDGLKGTGIAKAWDPDRSTYVVTWNGLFTYAEAAVKAMRLRAGNGPEGALIQDPRQAGEKSSNNPTLATLETAAFADESLTVSIDPAHAAATAEVTVLRPDEEKDLHYGPPADSPRDVPLKPRSYTIRAQADGYKPKRPSWRVNLYAPTAVLLEFEEGTTTRDLGGGGGSGPDGEPPDLGGGDRGFGAITRVTASAADPSALVEIRDEVGNLISMDSGSASVDKPGWYAARIVTPDGTSGEERFEVEFGQQSSFMLTGPIRGSNLADELVAAGQFETGDLGVELAEEVGIAAAPSASTLVGLAVGVVLGATTWGYHLKQLADAALPGLQPGRSLHVALLDQRPPDERSRQARVELHSLGIAGTEGAEELVGGQVEGVGVASFDVPHGPHLVTIHDVFPEPLSVPAFVFDGRPTLVIAGAGKTGRPRFLELASSLFSDERGGEQADVLRRFASAQRFVADGDLAHAHQLLAGVDLADDPLARCLFDYLGLRLNTSTEAADAIVPIREIGLADGSILHGLLSARDGDLETAREAMAAATLQGLPIFDIGMIALDDALGEEDGSLRVGELARRRIPNQVITTLSGKDITELSMVRETMLA